jgi:hypothetical protein
VTIPAAEKVSIEALGDRFELKKGWNRWLNLSIAGRFSSIFQ